MKNARAKRAKILFFIVKYANLWGFCCRRRRDCLSSLKSEVKQTSILLKKILNSKSISFLELMLCFAWEKFPWNTKVLSSLL